MGVTLIEVWVPGKARPKGSLRCEGPHHHMTEDNPESKPWRAKMAREFTLDFDRRHGTGEFYSYGAPVEVTIISMFPPPVSRDALAPDTRSTGDGDKIVRNVLDALQDAVSGRAAVLADDAQVVRHFYDAQYAEDAATAGLWVRVETLDNAELIRRRLIARAAAERFRASLGLMSETGY